MIEEKSISIIFICRNTIDYYQMCKFKKKYSASMLGFILSIILALIH